MDHYGIHYVDNFKLTASDGYSKTMSYTKFYMGSPLYYKDAIGEYSMMVVAVNRTWLASYKSSYGNLRPFGTLLSSGEKVSDVVKLNAMTEVLVNVSVNGVTNILLSRTNMTSLGSLNFTSYNWSYTDNASGKGWGPSMVNGTTIASIADFISISGGEYNVSFISIDGWGTNWKYNKTQMVDGVTGKMINSPATELANEGKQTILNVIEDGDELGYADGPFRNIVPGQTRDRYQKAVVEIRFTIP
jgi:hypothetical protein